MTSKLLCIASIVVGSLFCGLAYSQTQGSTTLQAQATVANECKITGGSSLTFPTFDTLTPTTTPVVGASLRILCTSNQIKYINLSAGQWPVGGTRESCGVTERRMKLLNSSAESYLSYTISTGGKTWPSYYFQTPCTPSTHGVSFYGTDERIGFAGKISTTQSQANTLQAGLYSDTAYFLVDF